MKLENEELLYIVGGASISPQLINSLVKLLTTLVDLGRTMGSAFRYLITNKKCS